MGDAGDASDEDVALAAYGLVLDGERESRDTEVWPEHWLAVQVFAALGTQWNVTYGGYVGLRYEAVPIICEAYGIKKNKRAAIFASLRILENEALTVINER